MSFGIEAPHLFVSLSICSILGCFGVFSPCLAKCTNLFLKRTICIYSAPYLDINDFNDFSAHVKTEVHVKISSMDTNGIVWMVSS